MTTNQITYFLAVVKYKTFTLAAEELYISQSSLSKQIKSLEQEIGYPLFQRDSKFNTLTNEGHLFLEYAQSFSKIYVELMDTLNSNAGASSKKPVNLGVLPVISEYNIHKDLALFQTLVSNSNQYINLYEAPQSELLHMLELRKLDSAIIRSDLIDLKSYEAVTINEEELVVIYSNKVVTCEKEISANLYDVSQYPLITFDKTSTLYQITDRLFKEAHLKPNYVYIYKRHEQILSMVNAGFGVAIMPADLVSTINYPNIRIAHLEKPFLSHTSLVRLKDKPASGILALLFDFFTSSANEDEDENEE